MALDSLSKLVASHRSLATLGLPSGLVAALSRAGYETISDLAGTSEAELLEGSVHMLDNFYLLN